MPDDYHLYSPRQKRQFWAAHIEQWRQSNLSQSAYCRRHDLVGHRFFYWRRRIIKPQETISFLPECDILNYDINPKKNRVTLFRL